MEGKVRIPQRPQSAPTNAAGMAASTGASGAGVAALAGLNPRERLRQYRELVQQLQNTIEETKRTPPQDADVEEITRRRIKLERVLRDVQESIIATRTEQRNHQNQRFCKAAYDQIQKEETTQRLCETKEQTIEHRRSEFWRSTLAYRHNKNSKLEKQIEDAERFQAEESERRRRQNAEMLMQREEKLAKLRQQQEEKRAASARRRRQMEEHCEELLRRKAEMDREKEAQREEQCRKNEEESKRRQQLLAERKQAEAESLRQERSVKRVRGNMSKVMVQLRPHPVMTVVEKDYKQLWEELNAADAEQKRRFKEEEAIRRAIRRREIQQHNNRIEKATEKHFQLVEERTRKGDELIHKLEEESNFVARFRAARSDYYREHGEAQREAIIQHMTKAKQREAEKINRAFQNNYTRWNRRADNVMTRILSKYEKSVAASHSPASNRGGAESAGSRHPQGAGTNHAAAGEWHNGGNGQQDTQVL